MSKKSKQRKMERENEKNLAKDEVEEQTETVFPKDEEQEQKEDLFLEGKSIDEIIEEETTSKKDKNYLAIIILLVGALIGSLFIDFAQLLNKEGYSVRALKKADIFTLGDKTWVAYKEPVVNLTMLTVSEDELKKCPTCEAPKEVMDLFKKVMPTLVIKKVDINSDEGKKLVKENKVKVLPAMVFSDGLEKTEFYGGEAKVLFSKINDSDKYALNLSALGLPTGKYIELPKIDDSNPILGNKDAKVKIILFSDHQCPFCAKFFKEVVNTVKGFGDKVTLVYKDLPLDFHPQAMNAAMAGECAKDQGKFWEMSDRLYATQKQWGKLKDDQAKSFFKKQAINLKLDIEKFGTCLDEGKHKEDIEKSKKQAAEFGVNGTPGIFIGDEFIGGVVPTEQLKKLIQEKIDAVENPKEDTNQDKNAKKGKTTNTQKEEKK